MRGRALLSMVAMLVVAAVPATAELTAAASEPTSVPAPVRESTPRADLAREALHQSTPVMTVSNAIRRVLLRFALFFLVASAALAVAATVWRTRVIVVRCPNRTLRAWVPPDRAPPAFA